MVIRILGLSLLLTLMGGCQDVNGPTASQGTAGTQARISLDQMIQENATTEKDRRIIQGINHIRERDYRAATKIFNIVLVDDPLNAAVHALNGYAYHMLANAGDAPNIDLALSGYRQAYNIDRDNYFAVMQMGRIYAEREEYPKAQEMYAKVLMEEPDNHEVLYELSRVSYKMGDMKSAKAAVDRAVELDHAKNDYVRAAAIVYAALGDEQKAKAYLRTYMDGEQNRRQRSFVNKRVEDWLHLHRTKGTLKSDSTHLAEESAEADNSGKLFRLVSTNVAGDEPTENTAAANSPTPAEATTAQAASESSTQETQESADADSKLSPSDALDQLRSSGAGSSLDSQTDEQKDGPEKDQRWRKAPGYELWSKPPNSEEKLSHDLPEEVNVVESLRQEEEDDMIVIDVVVLRVSEEGGTSKGRNILENFALTLSPFNYYRGRGANDNSTISSGTAAFNGAGETSELLATSVESMSDTRMPRVISQALSFGNISYSLNIANASNSYIEVVGRPTLTTRIGKKARFFSGTEIVVSGNGQYGSNITQKPFGYTLEAEPISLKNGIVEMAVRVEGSNFVQNEVIRSAVGESSPSSRVFTTITSDVDTAVRLKLGETLILGGISERTQASDKSGFPGLMNLPIVQYLFSREVTESERRSIVYMLTPRSYKRNRKEVKRFFTSGGSFGKRPNLSALEQRHKDWFDPGISQISILKELGPVYDEFRTSDLRPLKWAHQERVEQQLIIALEFLWY